jgi:hypothetical protein
MNLSSLRKCEFVAYISEVDPTPSIDPIISVSILSMDMCSSSSSSSLSAGATMFTRMESWRSSSPLTTPTPDLPATTTTAAAASTNASAQEGITLMAKQILNVLRRRSELDCEGPEKWGVAEQYVLISFRDTRDIDIFSLVVGFMCRSDPHGL